MRERAITSRLFEGDKIPSLLLLGSHRFEWDSDWFEALRDCSRTCARHRMMSLYLGEFSHDDVLFPTRLGHGSCSLVAIEAAISDANAAFCAADESVGLAAAGCALVACADG